jgi:hypothetical protein
MWNVPIAPIPGPWPALPALAPWLAGGAVAAVLVALAFVCLRAARSAPARERPQDARVRRLHGVRAA